jgi:beta-glucanase (GH16 family)
MKNAMNLTLALLIGLILAAISGCSLVDQTATPSAAGDTAMEKSYSTTGYTLKWSDEFNTGTVPDASKWVYETGGGGWGNGELENYTNRSANSYLSGGTLVIKSMKENYGGSAYTSARIKTQGKYSFKFGKIVARIKLSAGSRQGIWPAFWMLGTSITSVGWPACGEIDILENIGTSTVYSTCHWSNAGVYAGYGLNTTTTINSYHDYEVEWDANTIRTRIDGVQYYVIDITPAELSEFKANFFIILNQAVGGGWPGSPNSSTVFPSYMYVDYVRVYQK